MKKFALILAVLVLVLCLFTGCGRSNDEVRDDTNVSTTTDGEVNGDNDTTDSAGDMLDDAVDATGEAMDDVADGVDKALEPNDAPEDTDQNNTETSPKTDNGAAAARQRRNIIRGTDKADAPTRQNSVT